MRDSKRWYEAQNESAVHQARLEATALPFFAVQYISPSHLELPCQTRRAGALRLEQLTPEDTCFGRATDIESYAYERCCTVISISTVDKVAGTSRIHHSGVALSE